MNKIPENQEDRNLQKIEHLEIEISILRDAYFQLEKAILKRKQVEEKYRLLVETSLDMIQSVNPSGKFDFVNDAWLKTLGYTREEVKNMNMFNIIHKDSLEHCKSLFSKVIAGESVKNIEAIFVAKDGRQINVEGNATPIVINGKVTATHGFFKDVTERKKAEHNLKERMKELELIYEVSRIMEEEASDIDRALNEVAGVIPSAYQFPELACASISYSGKTYETKNFKKTAWRQSAIIKVSGKEVGIVEVFYLQEIPFLIEEGKMINEAASLIGNITERKKAETEIEAEKEKLETYIESMVDGVVVTDAKGAIVQANKSYAGMLGYKSPKELVGKLAFEIIAKKDRPGMMKIFMEAMRKRTYAFKGIELTYLKKDGKEIPVMISVRNVWDEKGKLVYAISVVRDVTAQKKAKVALEESKESLAGAQRIAHLGNWDWNVVTNKLWWSDEIYRIFGLMPQQFGATYDAFIERVHPEDRESVKNAVNEALKKNNYSIDHRIVLPSGKIRMVHEEGVVTYDKSGKPIRMLGTVLDTTELRGAEEKLRGLTVELQKEKEGIEWKVVERTKELRETQKRELAMKDEFVFIATHDLRTPVTAVAGYLDFIREGKEKFSKETERNLSAIEEASGRLERLVEDLLQVARSESGTIKIKVSSVDINQVIEAGIKEVAPSASKRGISVESKLDQEQRYVLADKERLSEVIGNLLSNAVKFNREKGKIVVTSNRVEDKLIVKVSDTGYGIPKDQQSKVFQKFFRARTGETSKISGTGLGLFVVRMLIGKMGGNISFTSEEGKGTTFAFVLPVSEGQSSS